MQLIVTPSGGIRCIYGEAIDLSSLGEPAILRASHVEPSEGCNWLADLTPVGGPRLGPFQLRSDALTAEVQWLEANWLSPQLST